MTFRLSCPSCNTSFTLPALPAEKRATCPRCGDVFPIRSFSEVPDSERYIPGPAARANEAIGARKARARRSLSRAVVLVLGMGLMGLIAGFAVYIVKGGFQPKPEPVLESQTTTAARPANQLIGLGYLPADTNIVFAVQPGPIAAYSAGANKDPREVLVQNLVQAGVPPKWFESLPDLGISLQQIDHIAGGTYLGEGAVSVRLTVVLVLRKPIENEDDFLHKLKARKRSGKERYDIELAGFPLQLERVSETIWVLGWDNKDFQAVEHGGFGAGGKQFPQGLSLAIAEKGIPPDAALWLATNDENWAEKSGVKLLVGELMKKKDWLPILANGRSAIVALSFEDPPRLRLLVKTANDATGDQLRAYFQKIAASHDKSRHGGGGDLAFFDAPIDPTNGIGTMRKFLEAAGKP